MKYLDTIDRYPKISDADKESIKSALKVMWEKYPMKYSKVPNDHGSVTYIGFADEGSDFEITDEEQELLKLVEYILAEMRETSPQVQWCSDAHRDFIDTSTAKFKFPSSYRQYAIDAAPDPDSWETVAIPDSILSLLDIRYGLSTLDAKRNINGLFHSYSHAYDPNFLLEGYEFGSAPDETKKYADLAYNDYRSNRMKSAAENLGYASHFLTDVGNPLHTGMCVQQFFDYMSVGRDIEKSVHGKYERYVSNNWKAGHKFIDYLDTDTSLGNRNWAEGCKELGRTSNDYYSETIYTHVHDSTMEELNANTNLKSCTINRVKLTAKYTNGLVMYVMKG